MPTRPSESRERPVASWPVPVRGATCDTGPDSLPDTAVVPPAAGAVPELLVSPPPRSDVAGVVSVVATGVAGVSIASGVGVSCSPSGPGSSVGGCATGVSVPGDWEPGDPADSAPLDGAVEVGSGADSPAGVVAGSGVAVGATGVAVGSTMRVAGSRSVIPASPATWAAASWRANPVKSRATITRYRVICPPLPRRTDVSGHAYGRYHIRVHFRCPAIVGCCGYRSGTARGRGTG